MITEDDILDYLEHHGVKGMRWGQRRAIRKAHFKELDETKRRNRTGERTARSDPTFNREVNLTRVNSGVKTQKGRLETTKGGGLLTGRVLGDFRNSKGEKVSVDFANAVLEEAARKNQRVDALKGLAGGAAIAAGTVFVSRMLLGGGRRR